MQEQKNLTDFWDPTRTGLSAMQMLQGQQHLALQQQQVAQQGKNQEVDNLRQAAVMAIKENPMAAPTLYNKWAEQVGGAPITDPAAFIANPQPFYDQLRYQPGTPEHQQASQAILGMGETKRARSQQEFERQLSLEGNTQLSVASGGSSDPAAGFALSQSPVGQKAAYERQFDPAKQAKVLMNQDYTNQRAGIHAELDPLLSVHMQATDALSNLEPIVAQLPPLLAQREKDIATLGRNKAMGKYTETLKSNPDVAEYIERAKASLPQIEQQIQEIQAVRSESLLTAQKIAAGTRPATETDNIHALAGQANAQALHLQYLKAQKALAKDPTNPSLIESVKQVAQTMNARIEQLHTTNTSLDVRQDAQRETGRKNLLNEQMVAATNQGQQLFAALPTAQQTTQSAAKIAAQVKAATGLTIGTEEILKGIKNPNQPLVEVKMPGTTEEAGKFSMINNAIKSVDAVSSAITKPDGTIDREKVFSASLNIPFTEGRNINSMMEDAVSAKLRAETGAAANAEEVKSILRRFDISVLDKDNVIKDKISRLRRFLDETRVIRDSTGKIRELAAKNEKESEKESKSAPQGGGWSIKPLP